MFTQLGNLQQNLAKKRFTLGASLNHFPKKCLLFHPLGKHVPFVLKCCGQLKLKYVTSNLKQMWESFFDLMQPDNSSHIKQIKGLQLHTWGKHLKELTSLCCKWFDSKIEDQGLRSIDQSNAGSLGMWEWWQMISSMFVSSWISHLNTEPPQRRTKLLTCRLPRVTWCIFIRACSRQCDWCKTRMLHFSLTQKAQAAFCFHLASFSQRKEIRD